MAQLTWNLFDKDVANELQKLGATLEDIKVPEEIEIFVENKSITIKQPYLCLEHVKLTYDHNYNSNHDEHPCFQFDFPLNHELWDADRENGIYISPFGDFCNAETPCISLNELEQLNTGDPYVVIISHDDVDSDSKLLLSKFLHNHSCKN